MTYQQTLQYLFRRLPMFQRVGPSAFKKDLTNIIKLTDSLGHPQSQFQSIHIAGTNGKGSVTHLLAAALMGAGYRVGFYTSPHYRDFRERIKINGRLMSKRAVTTFVATNQHIIEATNASFFEVTVAMAFDYFAKEKVDIAIIETGLGGRLDSTNIITPLLSIITNISLDHQSMLGDTLAQIAMEKAGIIKPNIPVIIGEEQATVLPIFQQKAQAVQAPLFLSKEIIQVHLTTNDIYGLVGTFTTTNKTIHFKTDISGPFQAKNLQTAMAAYQHLLERGFTSKTLNPKWLLDVRQKTHFIGRWTVLDKSPLVLADSAHNVAGLHIFAKAIQEIPHKKLYIVLGTVNDKDPSYLFDILPKEAFYHFAKANIPRGLAAKDLLKYASQKGIKGKAYSSVRQALAMAKKKAKANDLIVVAGSIFVVAEVV